MKYIIYIGITLFTFSSCKETNDPVEQEEVKNEDVEFSEEQMFSEIESALRIPANEDYNFKIYREHLNEDDSLDYIITINQLPKAKEEAMNSQTLAKNAELGYMGNYNQLVFVDGLTKKISSVERIASSAMAELDVNFEYIRTSLFKDITVDFRIKNSCFRRFYTVANNQLFQTFETKVFDGLGDRKSEAYHIGYLPGTYSSSRDIIIYKGEMEPVTLNSPEDIYTITPKINSTQEIERKWFLNQQDLKYYTMKD